MNNKLDKKHKPKPKPKLKNKKKTTKTTQSKKKNEIKTGGGLLSSVKGLFSKNKKVNPINKTGLESLLSKTLNQNSRASSASTNPQQPNPNNQASSASNNAQQPLQSPEIPTIEPNVNPVGFNTIKSTSRCSIL